MSVQNLKGTDPQLRPLPPGLLKSLPKSAHRRKCRRNVKTLACETERLSVLILAILILASKQLTL